MTMEMDVLKAFSARRAMGRGRPRMLRGACYALADWMTRNRTARADAIRRAR